MVLALTETQDLEHLAQLARKIIEVAVPPIAHIMTLPYIDILRLKIPDLRELILINIIRLGGHTPSTQVDSDFCIGTIRSSVPKPRNAPPHVHFRETPRLVVSGNGCDWPKYESPIFYNR